MVVITCNLHWWCFPYANLPMYWCAQAHMATHCNFHCVVVFVICGVGSSVCVCVCVHEQCVCGVGAVYCVTVYVFVHGTSKQPRKKGNEDNKSTGKEDDRCAY